MSNLIDRYLDGDLTDEEARAFLDAVGGDPKLEAELRTYEQMLSMRETWEEPGPSARFADDVMDRVTSLSSPTERNGPYGASSRWLPRLAWAAGLAVFFGLGQVTPRLWSPEGPGSQGPQPEISPATALWKETAERSQSFRVVQLVYVPDQHDIRDVAVAGTFNGWEPNLTPMERRGDVWIAQLVLPPESHECMFVVDGDTWVTDPLAQEVRDDGFGRKNAVLDLRL